MFGNLEGYVHTGPFAHWPAEPDRNLTRGITPRNGPRGGSLCRPSVVDLVATDPEIDRHRDILRGWRARGFTDPDTGLETSWEQEHDNVHVWVGGVDGHMSFSDVAPQDPVFFFHHCFIDYVWELFREKIRSLGRDPERYYRTGDTFHRRNRRMAGFFDMDGWRNRHGYSDLFTQDVYRYAPSPTCGDNCQGSELMNCPPGGSGSDRCVPIYIDIDVAAGETVQNISAMGRAMAAARGRPRTSGPKFEASIIDTRAVR